MGSPEQSLITEEHRAAIGRTAGPVELQVRPEDVRRVRAILGDDDPRYGEETGIAPPYILAVIEPAMPWQLLPRVLPSGILTQTEWTFRRPLRIGERLFATHRLADIRDRLGGQYGYSVVMNVMTEYRDEAGELVATSLRTSMQFDPAQRRERVTE